MFLAKSLKTEFHAKVKIIRPILITHVDTFDNHAHQDPDIF